MTTQTKLETFSNQPIRCRVENNQMATNFTWFWNAPSVRWIPRCLRYFMCNSSCLLMLKIQTCLDWSLNVFKRREGVHLGCKWHRMWLEWFTDWSRSGLATLTLTIICIFFWGHSKLVVTRFLSLFTVRVSQWKTSEDFGERIDLKNTAAVFILLIMHFMSTFHSVNNEEW